jgi:hypothetical protein
MIAINLSHHKIDVNNLKPELRKFLSRNYHVTVSKMNNQEFIDFNTYCASLVDLPTYERYKNENTIPSVPVILSTSTMGKVGNIYVPIDTQIRPAPIRTLSQLGSILGYKK